MHPLRVFTDFSASAPLYRGLKECALMDTIFQSLLILMAAVWIVAIVLRWQWGSRTVGRRLILITVTNQ